jgi:hypothetical protein
MLDDKADEAYQSPQRSTKRTVGTEGKVGIPEDEREGRGGDRPMERLPARCDIVVELGRTSGDRRMLRIAFLKSLRKLCCGASFHLFVSSLFFG